MKAILLLIGILAILTSCQRGYTCNVCKGSGQQYFTGNATYGHKAGYATCGGCDGKKRFVFDELTPGQQYMQANPAQYQ